MAKGRILAIDYGRAKVGLAVTDPGRLMVFGRGVLRKKTDEELYQEIYKLVRDESVEEIVIGLPMGAEGEDTPQVQKIRSFGGTLKEVLAEKGLTPGFAFIDESFSTFEANQELLRMGVTPEQRRQTEDEMAAIILLRKFIDFRG